MDSPHVDHGALAHWLLDVFKPAELRSFLRRTALTESLADGVPVEGGSAEVLAEETAFLFRRHGLIGRELFVALAVARPLRVDGLLLAMRALPEMQGRGIELEIVEQAVQRAMSDRRPNTMIDTLVRLQQASPEMRDALTLRIRKIQEADVRTPPPAARKVSSSTAGHDGHGAAPDLRARVEHGVRNDDLEYTSRRVVAALRARGAYAVADDLEAEIERLPSDEKAARILQVIRERGLFSSPPPDADEVVFSSSGFRKSFATHGNRSFRLTCPAVQLRLGQLYALVGANGSGKSTFLRNVAGLLSIDPEGTLSFPCLDPDQSKRGTLAWDTVQRGIYFIPQRLVPWRESVANELRLHAARYGYRGAKNEERVREVCKALALSEAQMGNTWNQLSGGFQMRLELAKAFISTAKLLIFDEPLAPLDINAQTTFLEELQDEIERRPRCVLISTQHIEEAERATSNMFYIDSDGVVDVEPFFEGTCFEVSGSFADAGPFLDEVRHLGALRWTDRAHRTFHISAQDDNTTLASAIFSAAVRQRVEISTFRDVSRSLLRTLKSNPATTGTRDDHAT